MLRVWTTGAVADGIRVNASDRAGRSPAAMASVGWETHLLARE